MNITAERLAELKRIVAAATPGAWDCPPGPFDIFEDDHVLWIETDHDGGYPICAVDESRRLDAEYIATFDPPTINAMLTELEAARYVVETARAAKARHGFANIEEAVAAYDAARAGGG